jgi:hypothetical protein
MRFSRHRKTEFREGYSCCMEELKWSLLKWGEFSNITQGRPYRHRFQDSGEFARARMRGRTDPEAWIPLVEKRCCSDVSKEFARGNLSAFHVPPKQSHRQKMPEVQSR